MALLRIDDLTVSRGSTTVLHGVSLTVEPGEIVTVVGPNGSGKSTLLKTIIGALRPDRGRIEKAPGLSFGYVPQALNLNPALPLTVRRLLSLHRTGRPSEIAEALDRVGASALTDRQAAALSGGQLQRVLLARAILGGPGLLLLDEPTQGLDQAASAEFYRLVESLRDERRIAVLMVSHELHVVMSASDRVICLNGHVCCEGAPEVVLDAPEYRALFGTQTGGALALYRHEHDHRHDASADHEH